MIAVSTIASLSLEYTPAWTNVLAAKAIASTVICSQMVAAGPVPSQPLRQHVDAHILRVLQRRFQSWQGTHPIVREELQVYQKMHKGWRISIGSKASQGRSSIHRRDDSYVSWELENTNSVQYGRVLLFALPYDWEIMAVVQPIRNTFTSPTWQTTSFNGEISFGATTCIRLTEIKTLVGMISKKTNTGRKTYILTRERSGYYSHPNS